MVHGMATSSAFWFAAAQELSLHHRVTLFDLPGHGRSAMPTSGYKPETLAQYLLALVDELKLDMPCVVGHSFGGSVALHFACCYPDRLQQLVLADLRLRLFQPQLKPVDWPNWQTLKPALAEIGIHLTDDDDDAGYRILTELARLQATSPKGQTSIPPELTHVLPPAGSRRTAKRWLKLLDTTTAWEDFTSPETITVPQLKELALPILIIYGAQSPTLTTGVALHDLWEHSNFVQIDPGGHFFPLSRPRLFAEQVKGFLYAE